MEMRTLLLVVLSLVGRTVFAMENRPHASPAAYIH